MRQQFSVWLCRIAKSSKYGIGFVNPSQQKHNLFSK